MLLCKKEGARAGLNAGVWLISKQRGREGLIRLWWCRRRRRRRRRAAVMSGRSYMSSTMAAWETQPLRLQIPRSSCSAEGEKNRTLLFWLSPSFLQRQRRVRTVNKGRVKTGLVSRGVPQRSRPQEWPHMFHIIKKKRGSPVHPTAQEPPNYSRCRTQFVEGDGKTSKKLKK